ncbi:MAG: hypothetical protein JXR41_01330 [Bacteroidales bacterium]|nr:hypothetical protein [Bacteroidales bacterium]
MTRKVIYLIILLFVFAAGGSCSRYHQAGYHGPNRVRAVPHKEWKQPKSRYKKLSYEVTGIRALRHQGFTTGRRDGVKA